MSSEEEREKSSSEEEGEKGQYEDDSDDNKDGGDEGGEAKDDRGKDSDSSEDEQPSKKKKKSKGKKKIADDDDDDADKDKEGDAGDEGADSGGSPKKKKKKKLKKSKIKEKKKDPRSRYIDDAAEESDGEGGVRRADDDEEEDEESDDDEIHVKRKRKKAFIVEDGEEDEEEVAPRKERVTLSASEARLHRDDFDLIEENVGLRFAPEADGSDSESGGEDGGQPTRKRLKRGGRDDDDDEPDAMKVSKKKGSRGLEQMLFSGSGGNDDADREEVRKVHKKKHHDDEDSESSMDSFIEDDIDMNDREGRGRREDSGGKRRKRKLQGDNILGGDMDAAREMFGDNFEFDDEMDRDSESDDGGAKGDKGAKTERKLADVYEPALLEHWYMNKEDDVIRRTDLPERMQIELAGRLPVSTKEEMMEEARWMYQVEEFSRTRLSRDFGDDMVTFEAARSFDVDGDDDVQEEVRDEAPRMTRTERALKVRESLIEKICNVLCYIRGVQNDEIRHGPVALSYEHGESEPDWEAEKDVTPILDIPFIAKYRREYWWPELDHSDLWRILDADGRWSALKKRKLQLIQKFSDVGDDAAAKLVEDAMSEEAVSDLQAFFEVRYHHASQQSQDTSSGHKRPVKVSRFKQCEEAKLGQMVDSFSITPQQLAQNLAILDAKDRHERRRQEREQDGQDASQEVEGEEEDMLAKDPYVASDPEEDPVTSAIYMVPQAEGHGFRDATMVLDGVKYLAAKRIAFNPSIRNYIRTNYFVDRALVTVQSTKRGDESAQTYHRSLECMGKHHLDIPSEKFLELCRAKNEGLVQVSIRLSADEHRKLLERMTRAYITGNEEDDKAKDWDKIRHEIIEQTLSANVYPMLEAELIHSRARSARVDVGLRMCDKLETLLRVAPYKWSTDEESKASSAKAIMGVHCAQPTEMVVIDKNGEVVSHLSIQLRVSANVKASMSEADAKKIEDFIQKTEPDVIVLGTGSLKCRALKAQLSALVERCATKGLLERPVEVLYADHSVAYKYAHSQRGAAEFPRYSASRLMAVSLARRLQDPLREMAGLCTGKSEDLLSLPMHYLQDCLDKAERLKYLHRAFINVVNDVGVDINLAADKMHVHSHPLQFVAGLGPRKAQEFVSIVRQKGCVQYREQLLEDSDVRAFMRRCVWTNAAAFLRISKNSSMWDDEMNVGQKRNTNNDEVEMAGGGPLEGTRIHPEAYQLANKMASDTLEEVEGEETLKRIMHPTKSSALDDLLLKDYAVQLEAMSYGKKLYTCLDIRRELQAPFADPRRTRHHRERALRAWELSKREEFNLLTAESDTTDGKSTLINTIAHVKVKRVLMRAPRDKRDRVDELPYRLICELDNGLTGTLDQDYFGKTDAERNVFMNVKENDGLSCVIKDVNFAEYTVELSHLTEDKEQFERRPVKREEGKKKGVQYVRRSIIHPAFKNMSRMQAMEALKDRGVGEFIIRPSSQGLDKLAVTRKVFDDVYHDLVITMKDQDNRLTVGKTLTIDTEYTFEDLDELIIGYLDPLAALDKEMINHARFVHTKPEEIRQKLISDKAITPNMVPYLFGFNPNVPGTYMLYWQPGMNKTIEEPVRAIPTGFKYRGQKHKSMRKLIEWFKSNAFGQGSSRPQQPSGSSSYPPPAQSGWGGNNTSSGSNWGQQVVPPPPPPPPMGQGADRWQGGGSWSGGGGGGGGGGWSGGNAAPPVSGAWR